MSAEGTSPLSLFKDRSLIMVRRGARNGRWGLSQVLPLQKEGEREQVLAMLKGEG